MAATGARAADALAAAIDALTAAGVVGIGAPGIVLTIALGLLAAASLVTVVQRMLVVRRQVVRAGQE